MKVRAKWNVKDGSGWHNAGEVFETESDLGSAVEILDAPEPVKEPEAEPEKEPEAEPEKAEEAPAKRTASRRKKAE